MSSRKRESPPSEISSLHPNEKPRLSTDNTTGQNQSEATSAVAIVDGDPKPHDPPTASRAFVAAARPPQFAKKIVFKITRTTPSGPSLLPAGFEETTWGELKLVINALFLKKPVTCNLEELYQAVVLICRHNSGGNLYQKIEAECETLVSAAFQSLVGQSIHARFLYLVQQHWQDHCDLMKWIRQIAYYLELNRSVCSFWDMGLQIFRKNISLFPEVVCKIVNGLLKMIEEERSGEAINQTLLKDLLKMFMELEIYSESFEKAFLEDTSKFYADEGVKYMQQSGPRLFEACRGAFSFHILTVRLQEEHQRCLCYLNARTRKCLMATAEKQLLEKHISAILDKGFEMLQEQGCIDDLKRVYQLFSRVNAFELLRQAFSSYIKRTGWNIMHEEKGKDMVLFLLEFRDSLDTVWEESFSTNEAFRETIKESFDYLFNLHQVEAAILCILKTKRKLSHTDLQTELFQQLKFSTKRGYLKKVIKSLIERGFVKRDKTDAEIYYYLT